MPHPTKISGIPYKEHHLLAGVINDANHNTGKASGNLFGRRYSHNASIRSLFNSSITVKPMLYLMYAQTPPPRLSDFDGYHSRRMGATVVCGCHSRRLRIGSMTGRMG